jgi:hypothetical protein
MNPNRSKKRANAFKFCCLVFLVSVAWLSYIAFKYVPQDQDWTNTSKIEGLYERISTSRTRSGSYNTTISGRDISCDASAFMAGANCPAHLNGKLVRATTVKLKMWWATEDVAISLISLDKDLVWSSHEPLNEMIRNFWYKTILIVFQISIVVTLVLFGLRTFLIMLLGTEK